MLKKIRISPQAYLRILAATTIVVVVSTVAAVRLLTESRAELLAAYLEGGQIDRRPQTILRLKTLVSEGLAAAGLPPLTFDKLPTPAVVGIYVLQSDPAKAYTYGSRVSNILTRVMRVLSRQG